MPSMDIVSELDLQAVDDAINQTAKEIGQRFDFRGSKSSIEFDKVAKKVKIMADDDMKLRSIHQVLMTKMAKRGLDARGIDFGKEQPATGNMLRQEGNIRSGLTKDEAKEINKLIKEMNNKLTAQTQDDQVRVSGKNIDDLQALIAFLRSKELKFPLQFINMKRN